MLNLKGAQKMVWLTVLIMRNITLGKLNIEVLDSLFEYL